jgi:hypothetical protein
MMSSGTRVNWRKGFFRVWVLGTVLWIPLSALAVADDLARANNRQGPRLLTDAEFFALPPVTQPPAQTGTGMFDDIPMATSEGTADNPFEHLIPAAPAGSAGSSIDDILNSVPTTRPPEGRAPIVSHGVV